MTAPIDWAGIQGANYVPSYSYHDVLDIFTSRSWNASVVDRELGYAKKLAVTSLRVFLAEGAWRKDLQPEVFIENYKTFQRMMKAHGLTLMATVGSKPPCEDATRWIQTVVGAEIPGVVVGYEAGNEPAPWAMGFVKNCSLPAMLRASRNPDVKVGVGYAHFREVFDTAHMATSLNWHSYTGVSNGGGLQYEIDQLRRIANKTNPPKPLILTEWMARPAQPLAAAYPVIRDNRVAAYSWALVIVDCSTRWQKPVKEGDPPFQGLIWPNGTVYDDLEEGECMRSRCQTLTYVHHCCNRAPHQDNLFNFSSSWQLIDLGHPVFTRPGGPREGSMRQTTTSGSTVTIGPMPTGTRRVALYLPTSTSGTAYTVSLNGQELHRGTTLGELNWVARVVLQIPRGAGGTLMLKVAEGMQEGAKFNVTGATFFTTEGPAGEKDGRAQLVI